MYRYLTAALTTFNPKYSFTLYATVSLQQPSISISNIYTSYLRFQFFT
jgi:hypothetical protein